VPCRINVFSGQKRERSPRENPPNGDFGGFSHGDLSPRQVKIRQTVAENATHGMSRSLVWRGERLPCENTKKSPFGGFSRGAFSPFRPENTIIRNCTNQPPYLTDIVRSKLNIQVRSYQMAALYISSCEQRNCLPCRKDTINNGGNMNKPQNFKPLSETFAM